VAYRRGEIRVYEVAIGSERFHFAGHTDSATGVSFSPDGSRLCSYAGDRTLLVWDVTGDRLASAPPPRSAEAAWTDLSSTDGGKGFAAVRYLAADPASAVRLLADRVKPVATADPKAVAALVGKLGSTEFEEREAASKALAALAPAALDQLREAAGKSEWPEVRTRLAAILAGSGGTRLAGEHLRAARAVEALERIGSPGARKVLLGLAGGAAGAGLTRDAAAAVERLAGKK
jgi:hypothetical protein